MAFSIQTNVASLQAQESLRVNQEFQARTINRLTSGYRINSSGDDAAGLSVANQFRSSVMELSQGVRNANDGISQLQIIDGGLTNIAKMLDRMKTLATQSASTTFSGDRATLDKEYRTLVAEIDRQAANIQLNSNGTYNSKIEVYIGGAADSGSNAKVSIDLSDGSVDSASLDIDTTSVLGGGVGFGTYPAERLDSSTVTFAAGTQFTVNYVDSNNVAQQVTITTSGSQSGALEVAELNDGLEANKTGITAQIDKDGKLEFVGNGAFAITTNGANNGITDNNGTAMYLVNEGKFEMSQNITFAAFTNGAGSSAEETIRIIDAKGNEAEILISAATIGGADGSGTLNEAVAYINSELRNKGVEVSVLNTGNAGGELSFQSAGEFTVQQSDYTAEAGGGAGALFGDDGADGPLGLIGEGAQTVEKSATGQALQAIDKISEAVKKLGVVQGTVGTGQNQLAYAIQLANSQISNFSAAESRIRDADVAAEAANLTKAQVLQQASIAAMGQANSAPQAVLSLLRS